MHGFSARVFLDGSENLKNTKNSKKTGPDIQNSGQDIKNKRKFKNIIDFHVFSDIFIYFHIFPTSLYHFRMLFNCFFVYLCVFSRILRFLIFSETFIFNTLDLSNPC